MSGNTFVKNINFNKSGGKVSVHVFFGQAQYGEYLVRLSDENGKNSKFSKEGNNIDDLPDRFELPTTARSLDKKTLSWLLTIAAPDDGAGQLYFARITVLQDGNVLADSPFEYNGQLQDSKLIIGVARFVG